MQQPWKTWARRIGARGKCSEIRTFRQEGNRQVSRMPFNFRKICDSSNWESVYSILEYRIVSHRISHLTQFVRIPYIQNSLATHPLGKCSLVPSSCLEAPRWLWNKLSHFHNASSLHPAGKPIKRTSILGYFTRSALKSAANVLRVSMALSQ